MINLAIWLRSLQVRCSLGPFTAQRYPMQRSLNFTQTPIRRNTATMNAMNPHTSRSLRRPCMGISDSSTPTVIAFGSGARDVYPAWFTECQIPPSKEEIEGIFSWISPRSFGYREDSLGNMMGTFSIGAELTWLVTFVPYLSISLVSQCNSSTRDRPECLQINHAPRGLQWPECQPPQTLFRCPTRPRRCHWPNPEARSRSTKSNRKPKKATPVMSLNTATNQWRLGTNNMSQYGRMRQISLYLLCWGEAAQVRFATACLCRRLPSIPECQSRVQPVKEGLYLQTVIKPLYLFIRDQGYEVVDGRFVHKDSADIIGHDDVNQLFLYPEDTARIVERQCKSILTVTLSVH